MKFGANITQSTSIQTASNFDLFSLAPMLSEVGHTVRIFTRITRNTVINKPYKLHDYMKVESLNKLDVLLVFNGPINFFGGTEDPGLPKQYELINSFDGPVYYIMTDCRYPMIQLWKMMLLKEWHTKYDESKLMVMRDDIQYIYQGTDVEKLINLNTKRKKNVIVKSENVHCFPIDWAIMLNPPESFITPIEDRPYDLIYGGSNRDAARRNKLDEYYIDNNLDCHVFGSIKVKGNKNPVGTVPHKYFIKYLSKGMATVIIGDRFYNNNFYTLRMYESILAGCLTFIDSDFDIARKFYSSRPMLQKLMYVDGLNDLRNKLSHIKDNGLSLKIQNEQLQCIKNMHDPEIYKSNLLEIIDCVNE